MTKIHKHPIDRKSIQSVSLVIILLAGSTCVSSDRLFALEATKTVTKENKESLPELRSVEIPTIGRNENAKNYHSEPVEEERLRDEPLIAVHTRNIASESYYHRADSFNYPYQKRLSGALETVWLRDNVARKLKSVNDILAKHGLEVMVLDGYRSIDCQRSLWKYFCQEARRQKPKASEKQIRDYAVRFCSNPESFDKIDSTTWPTHITGGAVDLTIRIKKTGELLYMGGIFDDSSETTVTDFYERKRKRNESLTPSEIAAMKNRRLLYWSMLAAGFRNYPQEWWHFDFGNQMWLHNKKLMAERLTQEPSSRKILLDNLIDSRDGNPMADVIIYGPARLPKK